MELETFYNSLHHWKIFSCWQNYTNFLTCKFHSSFPPKYCSNTVLCKALVGPFIIKPYHICTRLQSGGVDFWKFQWIVFIHKNIIMLPVKLQVCSTGFTTETIKIFYKSKVVINNSCDDTWLLFIFLPFNKIM